MSGGVAFAGFEGAVSASDLFGVVCIVNILTGSCLVYAVSGTPVQPSIRYLSHSEWCPLWCPFACAKGIDRQTQSAPTPRLTGYSRVILQQERPTGAYALVFGIQVARGLHRTRIRPD